MSASDSASSKSDWENADLDLQVQHAGHAATEMDGRKCYAAKNTVGLCMSHYPFVPTDRQPADLLPQT